MPVVPAKMTGFDVLAQSLAGVDVGLQRRRQMEVEDRAFFEGQRQFDEQIGEKARQHNEQMSLALKQYEEGIRKFDVSTAQQAELAYLQDKLQRETQALALGTQKGIEARRLAEQTRHQKRTEGISAYQARTARQDVDRLMAAQRAENRRMESVMTLMDTINPEAIFKEGYTSTDGIFMPVLPGEVGPFPGQIGPNPQYEVAKQHVVDHLLANAVDPLNASPEEEAKANAMAEMMMDNWPSTQKQFRNQMMQNRMADTMAAVFGEEAGKLYSGRYGRQLMSQMFPGGDIPANASDYQPWDGKYSYYELTHPKLGPLDPMDAVLSLEPTEYDRMKTEFPMAAKQIQDIQDFYKDIEEELYPAETMKRISDNLMNDFQWLVNDRAFEATSADMRGKVQLAFQRSTGIKVSEPVTLETFEQKIRETVQKAAAEGREVDPELKRFLETKEQEREKRTEERARLAGVTPRDFPRGPK